MKVFVTGVSGFIGRFIVPKLVEQGHDVFCFDRFNPLYGLPKEVPVFYGDLKYYFSISEALSKVKPEAVIHLAAITTTDEFVYTNWEETLNTNIIGTVNLLEAARRIGTVQHFLLASSSEVYGLQRDKKILTEEDKCYPSDPYKVSKLSSEYYALYLHRVFGLPITIFRPTTTYGFIPRRTVIEKATHQMLKGNEVKLGNPNARRDFLYVKDHVNAYISCLGNEKSYGQVFNISTTKLRSIREAVEEISEELQFKGKIFWDTQGKRPGEAPEIIVSNEKIKNIIGWEPKYSFREGIREMVEDWRKRNETRS